METFIGHKFLVGKEEVIADGSFNFLIFNPIPGSKFLRSMVLPEKYKERKNVFNPAAYPPRTYGYAKAIKIRNLSDRRMHEYWVPSDGQPNTYQGVIEPNR